MRIPSFVLVSAASLGSWALAGCASTPPPVAPQATLAAVVDVAPASDGANAEPIAPVAAEPVMHTVEVTVSHLPQPATFEPHATTYVFWVRASDEDAWTNATHLDPSSESSNAEETTEFEYPKDVLFVHVTAESRTDVRKPSDKVVLSTRVSRDGACASGVNQNSVTMKIRMCH